MGRAGNLASYDPTTNKWKEWRVPGDSPIPYGVYVDEKDIVWLTNWAVENGAQTLLRFDPTKEKFEAFPLPSGIISIYINLMDSLARYRQQRLASIKYS